MTSGCGKDICTYAKKRIDKFHQCCSAGCLDGAYVGRMHAVKLSLWCSVHFCGNVSHVLANLIYTNLVWLAMLVNDRKRRYDGATTGRQVLPP